MTAARPLVACALHDGADIDACGCPALDSPGAIAYRGLLVKARAEIARITAELAAARAVPADVEAALDTWAQSEIFAAESEYEPRDSARADANRDILRATIARAISDATAAATEAFKRGMRRVFKCSAHEVDPTKAWGCPDCLAELRRATAARETVGGLLATAPDLSDDEGQYVADRIGLTYELSTDAGRGRAIKAMRAAEEIIARGPLPKGG